MRARRVLIVILGVLGAALAAAHLAGALGPSERRPGFGLRGEMVREAVSDRSFSDADELVELETRARWSLPHSVTVVCASTGANLYVPSVYAPGDGGFLAGRACSRSVRGGIRRVGGVVRGA